MTRYLPGRTRCMFVSVCMFVSAITYTSSATAAPVSFSFVGVPLVDFAQATYRNQLGRDFVMSSELVGMNKKVTINVKALEESKVPGFIDQVLRSQGVRVTERDGVFFMDTSSSAVSLDENLRPAVAQEPQPVQVPGGRSPAVDPPGQVPAANPPGLRADDEIKVVAVKNRSVDFMLAVVNGVAGTPVAKLGGGSRLVLSAPKQQIQRLVDLVDQLDIAAPVVEVSASFVEVTRSASGSSGLALVAGALSSKLGVSVVPVEGRISLVAGQYQLALDALAADGRFKQVSNSRVVGDDSEHLALSVGDETPTVGSTSADRLGNPVQSIVYRSSGVLLDVTPRVLGSGRLSLAVDGQVSSFQSTTNGVANSPTLVKRQVKTGVSLADGEVLVIGGLDDSKVTAASGGLRFLPASWASRSSSDSKTDLVLILSARVLPQGGEIASK
jgi:general secretion pathway protein D